MNYSCNNFYITSYHKYKGFLRNKSFQIYIVLSLFLFEKTVIDFRLDELWSKINEIYSLLTQQLSI